MNVSSLPFGVDDIDPKVIFEDGPPEQIKCVIRGCETRLQPANRYRGPTCPEHGIRCNKSGTYSYGDPQRNVIVDPANFSQRIIGHPEKFESDRFGAEKSEDALSWNVFRSFQSAGCLGKLAVEVFGLPTDAEPLLYLWGISLADDTFTFWDLLREARVRFESSLPVERPLTEPDIALHVPGKYLALIEAKFTSPNGLYLRGRRKTSQSLTAEELVSIYADPTLQLLNVNKANNRQRIHYQLWRNTVFAEWMAQHDQRSTHAYHFNLVREGRDKDSADEFHGLVSAGFKDRFRQVTWESIYQRAVTEGSKLGTLCSYMQKKTANLTKAFRL